MNNSRRALLITAVVLLIVILFFFIVTLLTKRSKPNTAGSTVPTIPLPTNFSGRLPLTIEPTFTGDLEVTFGQPTIDLVNEKQELRDKTPITFPSFSIQFDYAIDKFTVKLNEPKDQSRTDFLNWLKKNYPKIPVDRFAIQ